MLLGKGRHDEVGIGDGDEGALRLASLKSSFSGEAARAHCNQRLLNLISRSSGIGLGLAKACQSCLLIGLQSPAPHRVNHNRAEKQNADRVLELNTAEE